MSQAAWDYAVGKNRETMAKLQSSQRAPSEVDVAMQEAERAADQARENISACAHAMHVDGCDHCAVLARRRGEVKRTASGCKSCDALWWELDNGRALILRGDAMDRYRALEAAARAAQQSAAAAQTAGNALRDAFAQFCAGVAASTEA